MTDKSFGDHTNRNVVKNPLLSTAVTGLSIEDLTHNAVLLPVSLSQEVITRSEQQTRPQPRALEHTEHAAVTYPAGDANSNLYPPKTTGLYPVQPPITTPNPPDRQNTQKTQENIEKPKPTVSKASLKPDDDFDVNEYFARLHGTRYVSAPFNSVLKEDQNANLEATEENLEEINLNEPDKVEFQQSITADIAQNFSQLPTMLPQVASAVFSSFSNMLQTRKSREPTPEVTSGYLDVQLERSDLRESREVLPPPREPPKEPLGVPPSFGTSNYRLPPKKKYAQIPGLTSGDTQSQPPQLQTSSQNKHLNQNAPQYFVPSSIPEQNNQNVEDHQLTNLAQTTSQSNIPIYFTPEAKPEKETVSQPVENVTAQNIPNMQGVQTGHTVDIQIQATQFQDTSQTVLPPPPMFANQPRRDSQTGAGKSFLPPSVARRIGANHPIVKQQTSQVPSFTENIFIPTPVATQKPESLQLSDENQSAYASFSAQTLMTSIPEPSVAISSMKSNTLPFVPSKSVGFINSPTTSLPLNPASTVQPWPIRPEEKSHLPLFPSNIPTTRQTIESTNISQMSAPPLFSATSIPPPVPSKTPLDKPPSSMSISLSGLPPSNAQASNRPSIFTPMASEASISLLSSTPIFPPSNFQATNVASQVIMPSTSEFGFPNIQTTVDSSQRSLPPPPTFFNPNPLTVETKEFPPIRNPAASTPEPPKSVPEPPKASGNINYRMTKKRPQYYAGPIEGVGAISNNIKPVIAPIDAGSFHGALFTPQQADTSVDQATQNIGQYSVQTPFDISRPVESLYSNVAAAPLPDYNAALDMSRPTTESYSEPKQESSGFGLLGSLKSKLGSLDINKIQNTVTTFFDPAYNDTKNESANLQEHVTYGQQQYVQYSQPQNNNFEMFVPNVDQAAPAYGYNYQTQYDYKQTSQPLSQVAQNYYPIQSVQNVGNYFSDADMNRYQDSVTNIDSSQATQNEEYQDTAKCQEEINASRQPDIEIQQSLSALPPYQVLQASQCCVTQRTLSSGAPLSSPSNIHTVKSDFQQHEVSDVCSLTNKAQRLLLNDFSQPSRNDPVNLEAFSKDANYEQQTQSNTNISSETEVKQYITYQEPVLSQIQSSGSNEVLSQMSSAESAFNFFHNPISQIIGSKVNECTGKSVTTQTNFQIGTSFGAAASFFDKAPMDEFKIDQEPKTLSITSDTLQEPMMKEKDKIKDIFDDDAKNMMSNLQTNQTDFFSSLNPADTKIQSIFSSAFDFKKSGEQKKNEVITDWPDETRPVNMSSAPLFGLSAMLANKTQELHDLEDEMRNISIQETAEEESFFEKNDNKDTVSELNICETCREVNKPEDYVRDETDDLTTQLIENITSPIQLSNPVEVPLTESNTPADDRKDFDTSQCEEISHITEETIEAIQVQAATELLDEDQKIRDYGWSTEEVTQSEQVERDLTFEQPTGLEQHNYGLPVNTSVIGFFGSNSLFEDVHNKLKSDFEKQENVTKVLPRQISVPTAPPAEDESKSEGLDVHSIEQDASKDFPIFEEFVIEPDDGKTERNIESPKVDTFSSRVDKYKKIEDDCSKTSPTFLTSTSPSLPIASYFDTGNYAADTHYRNSISSPSSNFMIAPTNPMMIPPGFEMEFQRKLSTHDPFPDKNEPVIPETSTQTRGIFSATFSTAHVTNVCTTTSSTIPTVSNVVLGNTLPNFQNVFGHIKEVKQEKTLTESLANQMNLMLGLQTLSIEEKDPVEVKSKFSAKQKEEVMLGASIFKTPEFDLEPQVPMNFFSSTDTGTPVTHDQSFNRLASYFSSPAKSDHTKSFFELSQSENHYRLKQSETSQNIAPNNQNIPNAQYVASINLMRDLTSIQPDLKPEQIVRTVNYFTIEYDNDILINDLISQKESKNIKLNTHNEANDKNETTDKALNDKNETESKKLYDENENNDNKLQIANDEVLLSTLNTCKHCCNLTVGYVGILDHKYVLKDFKVKKCMDGNNPPNDSKMAAQGNSLERNTSVTVNFENIIMHEDSEQGVSVATESRSSTEYTPVRHHWFYRVDVDSKSTWRGFSAADSKCLEDAYQSPELDDNTVVATDGGRYDVNVKGRLRVSVYWSDKPTLVRRCSWFYKGTTDARYVPYTEAVAEKLEEEYRHGMTTGEWHRRLVLPNNEMVVMHGPAVMVHFLQAQSSDAFSTPPLFTFGKRVYRNPPKIRVSRDQTDRIDHLIMLVHGAGEYRHQKEKIQSTMRPRVVRRGHDESEIEEMEPSSIDHLLLLCHGVGSACDMRFRNVEEVVDDFRSTSLQLIQSHYKAAYDSGVIGRVEVLPISWHATLHSGETGVDRRLSRITLDSIPRLRTFTNDTVLDVLFYTSPVFCQTIIDTVCAELNRIYRLFRKRNPKFTGNVSLGGHSLGSVILYDLLCHQLPKAAGCSSQSGDKRYVSGAAGTGQLTVNYPTLDFSPVALYALGSPIAIFECIRGVDSLGADFALPTCKNFFNIFHPYDPIAYRIEPLINPILRDYKPHLIPHHKGRKRMHLELKDTMARVGADIKQKLIESIRSTWSSMWRSSAPTDRQLERVVEEELEKEQISSDAKEEQANDEELKLTPEMLGKLNNGRRIDYVLQEAPFEMINEYLFAMSSHVCYWESEDTMLLMLREIYDALGVRPDNTVPQNTLTVTTTRPLRANTPTEDMVFLPCKDYPSTSRDEPGS